MTAIFIFYDTLTQQTNGRWSLSGTSTRLSGRVEDDRFQSDDLGVVSTNARLNEVALPSAAATDASRVLFFGRVDYISDSAMHLTQQSSPPVQALYFQMDTIQIP